MSVELPYELIRDIVELAAQPPADLSWVAGSLSLVCRDVHAWVHPVLVHTVFVDKSQRDAFYKLAASKPASYYAPTRHFLQRGFFDYEPPPPAVLAALAAVQTFTLDSAALDTLALADVFSPERLFLLSFATGRGTWLNNAHAFKNLTHLRVLVRADWPSIAEGAPRLTHVCIDCSVRWHPVGFTELPIQVRGALNLPNCERVVVRMDLHLDALDPQWEDLLGLLRPDMDDPRVFVYSVDVDERIPYGAPEVDWFRVCAKEARLDVDAWDQGDRLLDL